MTLAAHESKCFEVGTTGWTASDLDDPVIEQSWLEGRYEIVEGVLTTMPPAYFVGGHALSNLVFLLMTHCRQQGLDHQFATEVDVVIDEARVARIDAIMLTPQDRALQAAAAQKAGRTDLRRTRILIPPTLAIEVVSPGHEFHDRRTKRQWYREFGVQHYWILDPFQRSLQGLVLQPGGYQEAFAGRREEQICVDLFPSLTLSLGPLWRE
jgi:Uma2 family endonuclease